MTDTDMSLRARHVRLVNILRRIVADVDRLSEDEHFADYDQAVEAAKHLLEEEEAVNGEQQASA